MSTFNLIIRTPEKEVFRGAVNSFSFAAEDGRVQILPHHAHYMTTLEYSSMKLEVEGKTLAFSARSGVFTFDHVKNEALLLCLYCEETSEVTYKSAQEYLEFLRTQLAQGDLSDYEVLYLQGEKLAVEKQVKGK